MLLVVSDKTLVEIAKRNVEKFDVVPLHYNMRKADNHMITNNMILKGLITAYTGGNIGVISNDITKIWNSDNINLYAIKRLCALNNFTIDYAKTLYKPEIPDNYKKVISDYINQKVPHFFIYAKNKDKNHVAVSNNSTMNRIAKAIIDKRLLIKNINVDDFDFKMLMNNSHRNTYNAEVVGLYKSLKKEIAYNGLNSIDKRTTNDSVKEYLDLRSEMEAHFKDKNIKIDEIVDDLILYLFAETNSKHKNAFWSSFGDIVVKNLEVNLNRRGLNNTILCDRCGVRIQKKSNRTRFCEVCFKAREKELAKIRVKKHREKDVTV